MIRAVAPTSPANQMLTCCRHQFASYKTERLAGFRFRGWLNEYCAISRAMHCRAKLGRLADSMSDL